jgi:hypothetical protein
LFRLLGGLTDMCFLFRAKTNGNHGRQSPGFGSRRFVAHVLNPKVRRPTWF